MTPFERINLIPRKITEMINNNSVQVEVSIGGGKYYSPSDRNHFAVYSRVS